MKFIAVSALSAFLLVGCSKVPDTTEAVKQGIVKDLEKRVDVNNMDVSVSSVTFRGKEADAMVSFSPKGQPAGGMQLRYTMEKKDDGWHILRRKGDAAAHGGGMQPGQSGPGNQAGEGTMPLGHPPVGNRGGQGMTAPPIQQ